MAEDNDSNEYIYTLYGLDEQFNELKGILNKFSITKEGGSCVVTGQKGSGKSTAIKLLSEMFCDKIQTITLDCNFLSTNSAGLRKVESLENHQDEEDPTLIVLENFEILAENRDQTLLYKILNGTRNRSWFVILVSDIRNCTDCLEKRVRSRVSNKEIVFEKTVIFDRYVDYFKDILKGCLFCVDGEPKKKISKKLDKIVQSNEVHEILEELYTEDFSIETLKKIVSTLVSQLMYRYRTFGSKKKDNFPCLDDIPTVLRHVVTLFIPQCTDGIILKSLTIRQLCLLLCIIKLMKTTKNNEFLYHNILQSYRRFRNVYDRLTVPELEMDIYKELDEMVERGLIHYSNESQMGQLCFRRVKIGVDPVLVENCIREYKPLPSSVKMWLEDTVELI
uniref:Origin recognition complex subunit 4 n=1 Tax=Parastrongyloides trichosuri TaxID=131310 RepID=A0A0N4ZEX9_PARTI